MRDSRFVAGFAAIVVAAALAHAKDKEAKPKSDKKAPQEAAKQITTAINKKDLAGFKAGLERAQAIRDRYDDKKFAPVLKAVGKALGSKEPGFALAAIETLGKLKAKGSSKLLARLIAPPNKVPSDMLATHVAAITAAGEIQDPSALKALEKLLGHPVGEITVAAASALGNYRSLDTKPKNALVQRLVKSLAKLEGAVAKTRDEEAKTKLNRSIANVNETIGKLAGHEGPTTAAEWSKWIKESAKADQ